MKTKSQTETAPQIEVGDVLLLPPDVLEPMPDQPRTVFDENFIRGIADKAEEWRAQGRGIRGSGFIDVVKARLPSNALDGQGRLKSGVKIPFYAGENRWRAANFANERRPGSLPVLPVVVENLPAEDVYEMAYFSNALRRNFTELDDAIALLRIKNKHKFTLEQLARYAKMSMGELQNRIDVAQADPDVWVLFNGVIKKPLSSARRISTLKKPGEKKLRKDLIRRALEGAPFAEINGRIAAHNIGIAYEDYLAGQEVASYERQGRKEAQAASSSAPTRAAKPGGKPKKRSLSGGLADDYDYDAALDRLVEDAQEAREQLRGAWFSEADRRRLHDKAAALELQAQDLKHALEPKRSG